MVVVVYLFVLVPEPKGGFVRAVCGRRRPCSRTDVQNLMSDLNATLVKRLRKDLNATYTSRRIFRTTTTTNNDISFLVFCSVDFLY